MIRIKKIPSPISPLHPPITLNSTNCEHLTVGDPPNPYTAGDPPNPLFSGKPNPPIFPMPLILSTFSALILLPSTTPAIASPINYTNKSYTPTTKA